MMSDHTYDGGVAAATSTPLTAATPVWLFTGVAPLQRALSSVGQAHVGQAATVWPTGQNSDAVQRADRYLPQTVRHPHRTRPALAAQAIHRYSRPGQTVFDPFVGSGTTMIEAVYAGRAAIGVDVDTRWVDLTRANLDHAHRRGATGSGSGILLHGDARQLPPVPRRLRGAVDLVVTTPPARLQPRRHPSNRTGNSDLVVELEIDLKVSLACWIPLLHPGSVIVLVTRLMNQGGHLLDLTVPIAYAAQWAGLDLVERVAAMRVPIRDTTPRPRRPAGTPRRGTRPRVVHDDVLVYRVPDVLPTWWRGRR